MKRALVCLAAAAAACAVGLACTSDFDPVQTLQSVRILASRVDKPYAKPGDTVTLEVLAVDARPDKHGRTMNVYWIPGLCTNPTNDAYYGCFLKAGPADGGAEGGPSAGLGLPVGDLGQFAGMDLTPLLKTGATFQATLPADIVTSHPAVPGMEPYGLGIAFNVACAGHLELIARDPTNQQSPPIGCFDDQHNALGPDDFVIGFTRVYAFANRTNENPVVGGVVYEGNPVDLDAGVSVEHCTTALLRDCPQTKFDVTVPTSSQEQNPTDLDQKGHPRGEQIWVAYYSDTGSVLGSARLLYDPIVGPVGGDTTVPFQAPKEMTDGHVYAVVHDNRGGAAWAIVPVHVQ